MLVHGFSVPQFIFEPTFTFLTEQGFRVLRYDLYGRGFSDRPDKRYDIDLYVGQLANLLDALEIREPVSLVGLSMGGPITATFTVRFPQRVRKLVLIDPVGAKSFPSLVGHGQQHCPDWVNFSSVSWPISGSPARSPAASWTQNISANLGNSMSSRCATKGSSGHCSRRSAAIYWNPAWMCTSRSGGVTCRSCCSGAATTALFHSATAIPCARPSPASNFTRSKTAGISHISKSRKW